ETGKLVKITLPISKETILNPGFNPYLFGLFKSFQIPFEFIRFKIKADSMKSSQYLVNLNDIAEVGIGLDTTSLDVALSYPFHALHIDDKKNDQKWYDYLSMLKTLLEKHQMAIVIRNVKTKEERDLLKNLGIRYI